MFPFIADLPVQGASQLLLHGRGALPAIVSALSGI
jgi:hypothetical protein